MNKLLSIGFIGLCAVTLVACGSDDSKQQAKKSSISTAESEENKTSGLKLYSNDFDPNVLLQGYVYISGRAKPDATVLVEDKNGEQIDLTTADSYGFFSLKVDGLKEKREVVIKSGKEKEKVVILALDKDFEEKKNEEIERKKRIAEQDAKTTEENRVKKEAEDKLVAEAKFEEERVKKEADAEQERIRKAAEEERAALEKEKNDAKEREKNATSEQRNAQAMANRYLRTMAFSKQCLKEQLTFEGFSEPDSQWAVDNITTDWNDQALKKAKQYLDTMPLSNQSLKEQLIFEGFSEEQSQFAIDNLPN